MRFELIILGSGSALPTSKRNTTAQVLNVLERFFLIDCGEATQHQLRKNKIAFNNINHILISHLHGDHFFGLFGLISTMALLGRNKPLNIFGPPGLENLLTTVLKPQFESPPFPLKIITLKSAEPTIIYEDNVMKLYSFGLKHSLPVWGFKFEEKDRLRKIIPQKIKELNISIAEINQIKNGKPLIRNEQNIPNHELTTDPLFARSYVFMTDTLLTTRHLSLIQNTDILYHEATFLEEDKKLAKKTLHSTAKQAGQLARQAKVKHLFMGHLSTRYRSDSHFECEAQHEFENSMVVCDGDAIHWPNNNRSEFLIRRNGTEKVLPSK